MLGLSYSKHVVLLEVQLLGRLLQEALLTRAVRSVTLPAMMVQDIVRPPLPLFLSDKGRPAHFFLAHRI